MAVFVWAAAVAGNWSTGANWQVGGVVQAAPPTAADDVQFGFGTGATNNNCTITAASVCRSFQSTGYTGQFGGTGDLSVGDASGGQWSNDASCTFAGSWTLNFVSTSTNGGAGWPVRVTNTLVGTVSFKGSGGKYVFSISGLQTTGNIALSNGCSLDDSGLGATCNLFTIAGALSVMRGSGQWQLTSTGAVTIFDGSGGTVDMSGSTIIIVNTSTNARIIAGGGNNYGTIQYTLAGSTGSLRITGGNTIDTIRFSDATNARTLLFANSSTNHVTNFLVFGTSGKLMSINSVTAGTTFTLVKDSAGPIDIDFVSVKDCIASSTGIINAFAGANSTDGGNNTNWTFTPAPKVTYSLLPKFDRFRPLPFFRRGKVAFVVPTQTVVAPPSFIPQYNVNRARLRFYLYRRGHTSVPVRAQVNPTFLFPQIRATKRPAYLIRRGRRVNYVLSQPSPPKFNPKLAHHRRLFIPRRAHIVTPVFPQLNPTFLFPEIRATKRPFYLLRRGKSVFVVPTQAAAIAPPFIPQFVRGKFPRVYRITTRRRPVPVPEFLFLPQDTTRRQQRTWRRSRGRVIFVVPTQTPAAPPGFIPQSLREKLRPFYRPTRARGRQFIQTQAAPVAPTFPFRIIRYTRRGWWYRNRRGRVLNFIRPQVIEVVVIEPLYGDLVDTGAMSGRLSDSGLRSSQLDDSGIRSGRLETSGRTVGFLDEDGTERGVLDS